MCTVVSLAKVPEAFYSTSVTSTKRLFLVPFSVTSESADTAAAVTDKNVSCSAGSLSLITKYQNIAFYNLFQHDKNIRQQQKMSDEWYWKLINLILNSVWYIMVLIRIQTYEIIVQGYTRRALRSEIRKPCRSKRMRGIGNSFQPAIVASRFDLMNCDIAPSAKITTLCENQNIYIQQH